MEPYRGNRSRKKYTLAIVLLSVILLLLIAVIVFFIAQEYIVFNADGFRFDIPLLKKPQYVDPGTTEPGDDGLNLEIGDPTDPPPTAAGATEPEPTAPVTEPVTEPVYTSAFYMASEDFSDFVRQPQEELATGYALMVKDTDGLWRIPASEEPTREQTAIADGVSALRGDAISCVAIATVYRDDTGPRADRQNALRTHSNVIWLDRDSITWYNPYHPAAEEVLLSLVEQCVDAGFDEILLRDLIFVTWSKKLDLVNFGEEDSPQARRDRITQLAQRAASRLKDLNPDCRLSVLLTDEAALNQADDLAGQDIRLLAEHCDVLYVETGDAGLDVSHLESAIEGTGCRIGLYLTGDSLPTGTRDFISAPGIRLNPWR